MNETTGVAFEILLAEDDVGQARLVERNLHRAGIHNPVIHVTDGEQALDFMFRRGAHAERSVSPVLALLDINMPLVSGIEVLRQIKADSATRATPVIMLTTTDEPAEIGRCYDLGCSIYVVKPLDHGSFMEAINRLGLFLQIVQVPGKE